MEIIIDFVATLGLGIIITMLGYNFVEDANELETVELAVYFGIMATMVLSLVAIWN